MEYRVEIYSNEKGNFQVEVVYEGEDINEGIHQETLARERLGNGFRYSRWYGKDKNCKVRRNTWLELLW
jgi:hypothetical protein